MHQMTELILGFRRHISTDDKQTEMCPQQQMCRYADFYHLMARIRRLILRMMFGKEEKTTIQHIDLSRKVYCRITSSPRLRDQRTHEPPTQSQ